MDHRLIGIGHKLERLALMTLLSSRLFPTLLPQAPASLLASKPIGGGGQATIAAVFLRLLLQLFYLLRQIFQLSSQILDLLHTLGNFLLLLENLAGLSANHFFLAIDLLGLTSHDLFLFKHLLACMALGLLLSCF